MCGIVGWVNFKSDLSNQIEVINKMADTIQHRGPDQASSWVNEHVAFGHKRLIVVDPEGGGQPMCVERNNENYVLIYNGELYNTEDIRHDLFEEGWSFNSHSDTEVVLKSYLQWGEDCVERLNGIFAFAVYDPFKAQVFLARDRLGVKPLFYTEVGDALLFASELKALLAHDQVKPILDQDGLQEVLALGPSRTPGHGVFKGIKELRAAHVGIFDYKGWRTRRYWNVQSKVHEDTLEETAAKIRELFIDAVERQLISDVPIGTFLSGGVDSSAITAVAANYLAKEKEQQLLTFSIDYENNQDYFEKNDFQPSRDADFIGKMVEAHDTEHHNFILDNDTLKELLKEAVKYRDLPGMADVDSSLLWFCQQAKQHVTVALSGECADEIFGGYPWFYRTDDLNRVGFPWIRSTSLRNQLIDSAIQQKIDLDQYRLDRYQETIEESPKLEQDSELEAKRREMFYLNMQWFMPTLLDRKDRMSMACGFEARVPFSDHRLVEYVWNIPWEMKMYQNKEKGILRKALEGLLPDEILYRKKSPYPKTYHPDYTKAVVSWMKEILDDQEARLFEIFDRSAIEDLVESEGESIDEPWFGQLMKGPQLLAYLAQFDYWLRTYDVKLEL